MVLIKALCQQKVSLLIALNGNRSIQTSAVRVIDIKWREERGLSKHPYAHDALTNLPDYTFMDGRITPLGGRHLRRIIRQRELTTRIVALTKELDDAKIRRKQLNEEQERTKQSIIDSKLKEKGFLLLKK